MCAISAFFNARGFAAIAECGFKSAKVIFGRESQSLSLKNADDKISFLLEDSPFVFRAYNATLDEIRATRAAVRFIESGGVKIHLPRDGRGTIHAKLYYLHEEANKNARTHAIIGSSNLTAAGLGLNGDASNEELNLLCTDERDKDAAKGYFDALLAGCEEATEAVIAALDASFFYHAPSDVLQKVVSYYAEETPLDSAQVRDLEAGAAIFGLYDFQKVAAKSILLTLKNHHIAILADPVGSGKTLTSLAVAYTYANVAIIAPPKLKAQWESYFDFDEGAGSGEGANLAGRNLAATNTRVFTYHEAQNAANLERNFIKNANLVIIDESHNFRNNEALGYEKLKANLGLKSDLLLLSATPINNTYLDLAHQLSLTPREIVIGRQTFDPVEICREANRNSQNDAPLSERYYQLCGLIFSRQASEIAAFLAAENSTKRLPRQTITQKSLSSLPKHIDFSFDELLEILGVGGVNFDVGGDFGCGANPKNKNAHLTFCIYDPVREDYLPSEVVDCLRDKRLKNLGRYTTPRGFLCMKLIKALESSLDAFVAIVSKIKGYHENYLNRTEIRDGDEDAEDDESAFPKRLDFVIKKGFESDLNEAFKRDVAADLVLLERILSRVSGYESRRDFKESAKFRQLAGIVEDLGESIKSQKLLIFTESIKTADALDYALREAFPRLEIAAITGNSDTAAFNRHKFRFAPRANNHTLRENEREIDILVATDCISEGQNLQDCANLINYDIAFNPVRAIQRIGRIWRIGSPHAHNAIWHFFPDIDLERYIDLEAKLTFKLDAAASASAVENPFSRQGEESEAEARLNAHKIARKKQYEKMQKEGAIALEDDKNSPNLASLIAEIAQSAAFESPAAASFGESRAAGESAAPARFAPANAANAAQPFGAQAPRQRYRDGIFSILIAPALPKNLLFAFLEAKDSHAKYFCLYEIDSHTLRPSVTQEDYAENLGALLPFAKTHEKPMAAFAKLEEITRDYRDLEGLERVFERLTNELDGQIREAKRREAAAAKHNAPLFRKEKTSFALLAWLLINPDFERILGEDSHQAPENFGVGA